MSWNTVIDASTVAEHLQDPDWVIFDCRFDLTAPEAGRQQWQESHLPGARYAHLEEDLSGPRGSGGGRHPLPDVDALAAWLGRQGVGPDTQVVAYDAGSGAMAARLWWLLRWVGHEHVAVLDGGLAGWQAVGLPLTDEAPTPKPTRFIARSGCFPRVDAEALMQSPAGYHIVDARARERFRGEREPLDPVAGHVPGAANRPFTDNLRDDGHFKTPEQLREEWRPVLEQAGARPLVAMCGSGVTACHSVLALHYAGIEGVALYAGSWSDWVSDRSRPVETGDGA
jgi:thiosulfate/3-mercaptopyruvate sulfurtransferase